MQIKKELVTGNLVDIEAEKIYPSTITFEDGKISSIEPLINLTNDSLPYILPGFIDSHVHIESSMLIPSEFARIAVTHGTVGTVSDPHEIANVCGVDGVEFMIENGKKVNFKFNFGAPSCVPATIFETSGASITSKQIRQLLEKDEINYLSEMMNFPGVLNHDAEVWEKINHAKKLNKPIDGHAPGLRGKEAKKYIEAGISTDHECFTKEEALDKLQNGMNIIIREGSAAKNFDALIDLLNDYPNKIMFCSDDKHPDSLVAGHINNLCARAIAKGVDIFKVLKAACINPIKHYNLDVGYLRINDPADFIIVKDLTTFEIRSTYINGELVANNGVSNILSVEEKNINHFECKPIEILHLNYLLPKWGYNDEENIEQAFVIAALDGQLITNKEIVPISDFNLKDKNIHANPLKDLLKMVVVNRYVDAPIAKTFVRNFGLKSGAIASSVAHDSHNIIAVGADDESLVTAINLIIEKKGGISCVNKTQQKIIELPVAGLMSTADGYAVANAYTAIDAMAKEMGSTLSAPFMTLSFMALLVIPHLKLSDKGLFDGDSFSFI